MRKGCVTSLTFIITLLVLFQYVFFSRGNQSLQSWDMGDNSIIATQSSSSIESRSATNNMMQLKNAFEMRNLHENFPLQCGEIPAWQHPSIAPILDLYSNDREKSPKHTYRFNEGGHGETKNIFQTQVCTYDILDRWIMLTEKLNITQWAAHGGSAIGAKCFGAMSPWDDDIDMTVADCTALDALWEASEANISHHYPSLPKDRYFLNQSSVIMDPRLVEDDLLLIKGSICCPWYKLLTVKQALLAQDGDHIAGLDIECISRQVSGREIHPKRKSQWIKHMQTGGKLDDVMFGPTKIRMVPPVILNKYISLRYGKESPCRYPYGNGVLPETVPAPHVVVTNHSAWDLYVPEIDQSQMNYAVSTWYISKKQRTEWRQQAGNGKQKELTKTIPNLDQVEIDNSISSGCNWGPNATLKVIGWNAERGKYWDKFLTLVDELDALRDPYVILMNEMDIGMARSYNVHTTRRLALELDMNYAFGLEFVELTRGTREEQDATIGLRDALGLHGNAILSKCFIGDTMVLRDPLPPGYFSTKPVRGINANGFEMRLGGRMGIFARIFQEQPDVLRHGTAGASSPVELPPHFVVGNVHKVAETDQHRATLWDYYGFGKPPQNSTKYEGQGVDPGQQLGVIIQGDFGPKFCALGGLSKMNNYRIHKTFPVKCTTPKVDFGVLSADFFCSNMGTARSVEVSASCYFSEEAPPVTLSDHAIVSIIVKGNHPGP